MVSLPQDFSIFLGLNSSVFSSGSVYKIQHTNGIRCKRTERVH